MEEAGEDEVKKASGDGSNNTWDRYLEDVGALVRCQLVPHDLERMKDKFMVLVDVDISCQETFFVVDDMTQQVKPCSLARASRL